MTAERTYLSWLRYALWGGCHPELAEGSLSGILELANRQKTRGLVFEAMLRSGAALPEETAARMKELLLCIAPGEAWRSFVATIFNGFGRIFKDLRHK